VHLCTVQSAAIYNNVILNRKPCDLKIRVGMNLKRYIGH